MCTTVSLLFCPSSLMVLDKSEDAVENDENITSKEEVRNLIKFISYILSVAIEIKYLSSCVHHLFFS